MCVTIASKVFRAVSSALDLDFDPADVQSDANGSAKVALLLIAESRQAWQVLMQPGRARRKRRAGAVRRHARRAGSGGASPIPQGI
jgi:hypothetical protein